jgi:uncharacterized protein YbjT (DUF2867 family)
MSILLIGIEDDLGTALVERLVEEGDEVRVLEPDHGRDDLWKPLGAYVAVGPADDWDLVERAATNVRTVILGEGIEPPTRDTIKQILEGAQRSSVTRVVLCAPSPDEEAVEAIRSSSIGYVVLATGTKGLLSRSPGVERDRLVEAIDAADDLAGEPQLELDLTAPEGWEPLRLEAPELR